MANEFDAIILGAGAAGLMCAAQAGKLGKRVLVLDKAEKPGKKILISGGGRCNFTNIGTKPECYISNNPHFAKSALSRYEPQDFIDLVNSYGIAWHEKTLGQLFCDGSAKQIVDMLLEEVNNGGGVVRCNFDVTGVRHAEGVFIVQSGNEEVCAPSLVIATGGPSIPKMGSTGFAYDLGRQFGLKIVEPRPALVPFTLGGDEVLFRELSGVATEVIATAGTHSFREAALFTHKGLSGPAILQISSYWRSKGEAIYINFLPDHAEGWLLQSKRQTPKATVHSLLKAALPDRLAAVLADKLGVSGILGAATDATLDKAEKQLAQWAFHPNGTEGYAKAEVTVGGISTDDLSSKTMEARKVPGLFVIGEAMDVTGWLGGYNFQWAWASGAAAAEAL